MSERKFHRTYRTYQPSGSASGPPTERICKPYICSDNLDSDQNLPFNEGEQNNANSS